MQNKVQNTLSKAIDKAILQSIGDGLSVVDKEGNITYVNQAFEKLLGWKAIDVMGKYLLDIVHVEDEVGNPVPFKERILSTVLSGKTTPTTATPTSTYYFIRSDKSRFPVALLVTPVFLEGKLIGAVQLFRDITKEKQAQKQQTIQLLSEVELRIKERDFVSFASHQLMTPLALVGGYLSMLISGKIGKVDDEAKKYLDESFQGSQRMTRLIESLLTTSRLEGGHIKIEPVKFDLGSLLSDTVKEFQHMAQEKQLMLTVAKLEPVIVMADINYTKEIISNVINNALKYTEKGGVEVKASAVGNSAVVAIKDSGIGINQKDLAKVFDKFYMSENFISKQATSIGLGLYISRLLLDLMGGTIKVESKVGEGSTFTISLPLA